MLSTRRMIQQRLTNWLNMMEGNEEPSNVTLLHLAVKNKSAEKVIFLLGRGANPSVKATDGDLEGTPEDWARQMGMAEIVELFKQEKVWEAKAIRLKHLDAKAQQQLEDYNEIERKTQDKFELAQVCFEAGENLLRKKMSESEIFAEKQEKAMEKFVLEGKIPEYPEKQKQKLRTQLEKKRNEFDVSMMHLNDKFTSEVKTLEETLSAKEAQLKKCLDWIKNEKKRLSKGIPEDLLQKIVSSSSVEELGNMFGEKVVLEEAAEEMSKNPEKNLSKMNDEDKSEEALKDDLGLAEEANQGCQKEAPKDDQGCQDADDDGFVVI